jgi:hypothetical protein
LATALEGSCFGGTQAVARLLDANWTLRRGADQQTTLMARRVLAVAVRSSQTACGYERRIEDQLFDYLSRHGTFVGVINPWAW